MKPEIKGPRKQSWKAVNGDKRRRKEIKENWDLSNHGSSSASLLAARGTNPTASSHPVVTKVVHQASLVITCVK